LAACAAKEYFHETPVLLILLRKINKTGVSENFILPPKAADTCETPSTCEIASKKDCAGGHLFLS